MKRAIVYGATGLVGTHILETLLNHDDYEQITIVVRKNPDFRHPKLNTVIGDFHSFESAVQNIDTDEVYIALGTTRKKTPDKKAYYQVDHDYPVLAAKTAKENGAKTVLLVSSIGANVKSSAFYTRTKGEAERDIAALQLEHTYIFRPSLILGDRKEKRPLENISKVVWKAISPLFFGKSSRYKAIEAKTIAVAMVNAANRQNDKIAVFYWKEMMNL